MVDVRGGVQCALAALGVDAEAASEDPQAAAKTANTTHLSAECRVGALGEGWVC